MELAMNCQIIRKCYDKTAQTDGLIHHDCLVFTHW